MFAFMRGDAVLCRAAIVFGKRGLGGLVCRLLAAVRIAGCGRKLDRHSLFTQKAEAETAGGIQKAAPILAVV